LKVATIEEKKIEFERIHALVKEGYAGTLPGGRIVDRREHPEALPMQKNALLGVPEPKHVHAFAGREGGYKCVCGVIRPDRDDLPPDSPRRWA
jgi:hypothetical protein